MYNPVSTYRLQFHKDFTLSSLKKIITYLKELGITTIYASPILEAAPGSTHGYDGVNPHRINPEIGTEEELREINKVLNEHQMGWIQDIAPNHMSYRKENRWLMDVLLNGRKSQYADYFDILWDSPLYDGKIMVPFPGSELEKELKEKDPEEKHYKICDWQETDRQINYRRFFIVNDLICLNIQNKKAFDDYHSYIKQLQEEGIFQGLRIDHIDGLFDPTGYLENIRTLIGEECFVVVEKILEQREMLPEYWTVQGNTGYDFLSMVNNVFTKADSSRAFKEFYEILIEDKRSIEEQTIEKKTNILYHHMQGELENLYQLFKKLDLPDDLLLNFTNAPTVKEAIAQILIECPVYRYYENRLPLGEDKDYNNRVIYFYQRCMQFSGPLMAKGVEDTLMYTYNRFIGHNEVGDSPASFGLSAEDFHKAMQERLQKSPLSLNATATHDTKRGEDVRARLNVLTELKEEWFQEVESWYQLNTDLQGKGAPDVNDEYMMYQALCGSYPMPGQDDADFEERFILYLTKALREAKRISNWANPDEAYENATHEFAVALLNKQRPFWQRFSDFQGKILSAGIIYSLAQVIMKFTCPGVPDTYQGCELWDLSFVDPDNRRPVDYEQRTQWLHELRESSDSPDFISNLWQTRFDGRIKLWFTNMLLQERSQRAGLYSEGDYIPLTITGEHSDHVLAYARKDGNEWNIVAIPLSIAMLGKQQQQDVCLIDWSDTRITLPSDAPAVWKHLLTGKDIAANDGVLIKDIFHILPMAILR